MNYPLSYHLNVKILIVIKLLFLVKSCQNATVAKNSVCALTVHEQETSTQSVNISWAFIHCYCLHGILTALLLQSKYFHYSGHPVSLFVISKVHFHQSVPVKQC